MSPNISRILFGWTNSSMEASLLTRTPLSGCRPIRQAQSCPQCPCAVRAHHHTYCAPIVSVAHNPNCAPVVILAVWVHHTNRAPAVSVAHNPNCAPVVILAVWVHHTNRAPAVSVAHNPNCAPVVMARKSPCCPASLVLLRLPCEPHSHRQTAALGLPHPLSQVGFCDPFCEDPPRQAVKFLQAECRVPLGGVVEGSVSPILHALVLSLIDG